MTAADAVTEDMAIAAFYRAASGELAWSAALDMVSGLTHCWVVQMMEVNLVQGRIEYSYETGDAPAEPVVEYARRYHAIDPHLAGLMPMPPGEWYHSVDHFDEAAVATHPFYQEFLIPYGDRYVSGVKLHQDDTSAVILGLHRALGAPPMGAADRALVQRLGFHLREAIAIWRRQRKNLAVAAIGAELLDRMGIPILLLDSSCRIGVANKMARQLLASGVMREVNGVLVCEDQRANAGLKQALAQLRLDEPAGAAAADRTFVRLPAPSGADPGLSLCLLALRPEATLGAFGSRPVAMVLVHDASRKPKLDVFMVGAAYGLSPAEARVAIALASGMLPKSIASRHGVSVATVRTQMSAVYRKLNVGSAASLAALLNTVPFPFFGSD